jgi:hypothetical protein
MLDGSARKSGVVIVSCSRPAISVAIVKAIKRFQADLQVLVEKF